MIPLHLGAGVAGATLLLSRYGCITSRGLGALILGILMLGQSAPAFADQNIVAADSAQVDCLASAKDLTRISLVEDEFASVSKISSGNILDDFSVVNEPVRGDIYLSVPDGFVRPALSFFGTSKRGFVYKFVCRISGAEAAQVFVTNPAIAKEQAEQANPQTVQASPQDRAVGLIQAMFEGGQVEGFEMQERSLKSVYVGTLKVQLIAEYQGSELTGRVLRIENAGPTAVELTEKSVAPASALAISIAEPKLDPGHVTTAYLVFQTKR